MIEGIAEVCGKKEEKRGRYVVAAKDLETDQLVLSEHPYVFGPKQGSSLVCIECCKILESVEVAKEHACKICGMPKCVTCADNPSKEGADLHARECQIFSQNDFHLRFDTDKDGGRLYSAITILRLLLTGLEDFETHEKLRENTPIWVYVQGTIVPFIASLKDKDGNTLFQQEDIHRAAGALDTNTFEVKSDGKLGRALFKSASLFNNNCNPNCYREVTADGIKIKTSRPVKKGEELTICYTGLLTPTFMRQAMFQNTKHFVCQCLRCQDPTESNTYMAAIKCPDFSCGGVVLQSKCQKCGREADSEKKEQIERLCNTLVGRLLYEDDCDMVISGMKKMERLLSKHNYIFVKLKLKFLEHSENCSDCARNEERARWDVDMRELVNLLGIAGNQLLKKEKIKESHEALNTWSNFLQIKLE